MTGLNHIRVVLVEPAGALNVGAIARVMKNFGLTQLAIVQPRCEVLGDEARQMAVHAADVLESALITETIPEALVNCQRAIATTARPRALDTLLETPEEALPWLLERGEQEGQGEQGSSREAVSAILFGPEDRGLSNTELNYAQRFLRIPSSDVYPSLNLAQAVAVCSYTLYRLSQSSSLNSGLAVDAVSLNAMNESSNTQPSMLESVAQLSPVPQPQELASLDALDGFYQHFETVLLQMGYLYPHTAQSRMEKFRRIFNRAQLSPTELSMLRGVLSQMEWAMGSGSKE